MPIATFLIAAFQSQPAPPIQTGRADPEVLQWLASTPRCAGDPVTPRMLRLPASGLVPAQMTLPQPIRYRFRIDASGRPLTIRRDGAGVVYQADDIAPSLAASSFEVGGARDNCTIEYRPQRTSIDAAPVGALMSLTIGPNTRQLPQAGWARLHEPGATCMDMPRPPLLRRSYPDFRAISGTPGHFDWSMVRYDLDRRGRPVNIRVTHGTDNAELDAGSKRAVRDSRFYTGARTGCLYPYWRAPAVLAAPDAPDVASLRPANADCPTPYPWANRLSLTFPPGFQRRSIEGWAVVAFDVAPWGATGNVRVLASEPSAEFGIQASRIIIGGKKAPGGRGQVGCVDHVKFVIGEGGVATDRDTPVPAPLY